MKRNRRSLWLIEGLIGRLSVSVRDMETRLKWTAILVPVVGLAAVVRWRSRRRGVMIGDGLMGR